MATKRKPLCRNLWSQQRFFKFPRSQRFSIKVLIITSRLRSNEIFYCAYTFTREKNNSWPSWALIRVRFEIQFNSIIAPFSVIFFIPRWDWPRRKYFDNASVNDSKKSPQKCQCQSYFGQKLLTIIKKGNGFLQNEQ